ncbi:flagellin N-terminal helical domain-containing protein [Oryzibacter oryziterrae]|uniref:flagellin N-terminal helical domain-containing protein n=1 Tax=Oryzibacter oryziterrae TaxID=2766474 RepID=UPI001F46079F|nr:flagellin [Oryzibacter oryziterrae]
MAGITISSGVRNNLLALQQTASLMSQTQNRLATGKKVNSALDNANSFFTASSLNSRADDLSTLLDDQSQAVQTLKAADQGISGIKKLVEAAKAKANQALSSSSTTDRGAFASEYNNLLGQIEDLAKDSGYNGKNLLSGDDVKVVFNEKTGSEQASLSITGVDYSNTSSALSLSDLTAGDWASGTTGDNNINGAIDKLNNALTTLRNQASTFGTNLTVVQNRQDFTKNMINTLQEGADNLTNADTNEEGAKLLALQTRQSLSSTALSMASSADQAVLRLF